MWYIILNYVVDIAPHRFFFENSSTNLSIPVFTSHDFSRSDVHLEKLIIIVHGAGINAQKTFNTGLRFAERLGGIKGQYLIIAPQFLEGIEPEEKGLLFWGRQWRSGGFSLSEKHNNGLPRVSSYEVMDKLIDFATKRYSSIHQVILLGHSAGGQFVSRYAAVNNYHEEFKKDGVSIYYVVANPSSYLYLDATRYKLDSNGEILNRSREELAGCRYYNEYKYGLDNRYGYAQSISKQEIQKRLMSRPIVFVLGQEDRGRSWSLDKSCKVEVQGDNRYERGVLYRHHLQSFLSEGQDCNCHWVVIPEVGHDSTEMLTHNEVFNKLIIFDD